MIQHAGPGQVANHHAVLTAGAVDAGGYQGRTTWTDVTAVATACCSAVNCQAP
jgi:hypothetical protein